MPQSGALPRNVPTCRVLCGDYGCGCYLNKKGAIWPLFLAPYAGKAHKTLHGGGGRRIRTYGGSPLNGFQDRRFRPLSQPTKSVSRIPSTKSAHYIAAHCAIKLLRGCHLSSRAAGIVTGPRDILSNDANRRSLGQREELCLLSDDLRLSDWLG